MGSKPFKAYIYGVYYLFYHLVPLQLFLFWGLAATWVGVNHLLFPILLSAFYASFWGLFWSLLMTTYFLYLANNYIYVILQQHLLVTISLHIEQPLWLTISLHIGRHQGYIIYAVLVVILTTYMMFFLTFYWTISCLSNHAFWCTTCLFTQFFGRSATNI